MKRLVFSIIILFAFLVLVDNLVSWKSNPVPNSIEIIENSWQKMGDDELKFSSTYVDLHFSWSKFITYSVYFDRRIKAIDMNKSLPTGSFYEKGVDDNIPSLPNNNILSLNEAIYLSIYSTETFIYPNEEGYYNKLMLLKFNESLPRTIKRIFTNHYIYFQSKSSQLIALKLEVLPYDSLIVITLLAISVLMMFVYLMFNGITFIIGILLGLLYASVFTSLDFISKPVFVFIIVLLLPLLVTFKLKVWSVERKIFTSSFFMLTILLFILITGYFYFSNGDLKIYLEKTTISSIILMSFFALFGLGFTVYSMMVLYGIVCVILFGTKFIISDFEIRSAYMKTYQKSFPDYFVSLKINDKFLYKDVNCTRKIFEAYKQKKEVKLNVLYRNKRGDIVVL